MSRRHAFEGYMGSLFLSLPPGLQLREHQSRDHAVILPCRTDYNPQEF